MCGVVGILGTTPVTARMIEVLRRLEYRGYDSAGVATIHDGAIERRRATGKLANLEDRLKAEPLDGLAGIGHTRWATHGGVTEANAHPHATSRVVVVHNGIIENHAELKAELELLGAHYESATDTETIAHLLTHLLRGGYSPEEALRAARQRLKGHYAFVALLRDHPDVMLVAREGTPLVIGWGEGEMFLASDGDALVPYTRRLTFLEDGDWAVITRAGATIYDRNGECPNRPVVRAEVSAEAAELGSHAHYMHKEIHEQPGVLAHTARLFMDGLPLKLVVPTRILLLACGTAHYAGAVARHYFEGVTGLPAEVEISSEFMARESTPPPGTLGIVITQSGETLDTLEALRRLKACGLPTLAVVNKAGSTIAREADAALLTPAGPEIGVASTKAFTAQVATLLGLAMGLAGRAAGPLLEGLPPQVSDVLALESSIAEMAQSLKDQHDILFLGRGVMFPVAMEGALKLKEISYLHAEGLSAGELKHGPLAMLDEGMPVIILAPPGPLFARMVSTVEEVAARGGRVLLLSDAEGCARLQGKCAWSLTLPACDHLLQPLLYVLPLQLLAYHVALARGTDVDKPRNLAKSVTVG